MAANAHDRRRSRATALGVLAATILFVTVSLEAPLAASAKCQPGRTDNGVYYWTGWTRQDYPAPGASVSDIYNYSPWVQPGSYAYAWTMLNNGGSNWAQIGWEEAAYGTRYTFTQYTSSPGVWHEYDFSAKPTGQSDQYAMLLNPLVIRVTSFFRSTEPTY